MNIIKCYNSGVQNGIQALQSALTIVDKKKPKHF